jgi:hypothetical protein
MRGDKRLRLVTRFGFITEAFGDQLSWLIHSSVRRLFNC